MEIVALSIAGTIISLLMIAAWVHVRLQQHKIKYGNPKEIEDLKAQMDEYKRIINMLDQEALKELEGKVALLIGQLRESSVGRVMR